MIKFLSLFSGIGAFEKALTNLNIPFELINYCEIDKYASRSYSAIHNVDESKNLWDITKVDATKLPNDIDVVSFGFPCQDISSAGKMKGLFNEDGSKTRSGLFFEALRIIEDTKPRIAIAENVKNLTGKKFKDQFEIVLESLENAGYNNYWKVLNAKDFGIPQNRERVFIISIRKDIDNGYVFPQGFPLELRLKDMLEDEVDEKYYISKALNMTFKENYIQYDNSGKGYNSQAMRGYYQDGLCPTLPHRNGGDKAQVVLEDNPKKIKKIRFTQGEQAGGKPHQSNAVYSTDGMLPTQYSSQWKSPPQVIDEPICLNSKGGRNGIEGLQPSKKDRVYDADALGVTVATSEFYNPSYAVKDDNILDVYNKGGTFKADVCPSITKSSNVRIRKLTPKECWRLMGFDDEDFEKAAKVVSKSQLYKQAGNSICVDVLYYLIGKLRKYF